jgi:hypothetical protein
VSRFGVGVALFLVAGGAFWLGRKTAPGPTAPDMTEGLRQELQDLRAGVAGLRGAVAALSRQSSLAAAALPSPAARPAGIPPGSESGRAPREEVKKPRDERVWREAETLLDGAIARGAWTRRDEERLKEMRMEAPETDWTPFMQRLSASLNDGLLKPPPRDNGE